MHVSENLNNSSPPVQPLSFAPTKMLQDNRLSPDHNVNPAGSPKPLKINYMLLVCSDK